MANDSASASSNPRPRVVFFATATAVLFFVATLVAVFAMINSFRLW
jgi:hypothetical protein